MINNKYGKLTVVKQLKKRGKNGHILMLCKCDCGNIIKARKAGLLKENLRSCGCLQKENALKAVLKHGQYKTKLYKLWCSIKRRSLNKNENSWSYKYYQNIDICDEWLKYELFYDWAKDKYKEGLEIDRINNEKGYYANNCRFVTRRINLQNTRKSCIWTVFGKNFTSSTEAAEFFNVNRGRIHAWCAGRKEKNKRYKPKEGCCKKFIYQDRVIGDHQ